MRIENENAHRSIDNCAIARCRPCPKQPFTDDISWSKSGYHSYREMKPKHQKEMDDELFRMKDKSYKDALKSIPDSKIESDPWKDAR